jgi:hypothetical protein
MARLARVLGLATLMVLLHAADGTPRSADPEPGPVSEGSGLTLRLRDGVERPPASDAVPPAVAERLSPDDTAAVLARLPALAPAPDDERDFSLRESSLPRPRAGATVAAAFPPAPTGVPVPAASTAPPAVVRRAPEGDVPMAPMLSVTFSEPMVPLTSAAVLAQSDVPVRLTPQPPGEWRWVGTKTLLFEPTVRFPMATEYRVDVPAGVRSAAGVPSEIAVSWAFRTPAPTLVARYPAEGTTARRDPLLFAAFDQRIEPAEALRAFQILPGKPALRLATPEEIDADAAVRRLAEQAGDGRFVAFVAAAPLPAASQITVALEQGAPSAEGPRRTEAAQAWRFRTYGPLRIEEHACGWGECPPGAQWRIRFSSALDPTSLRADAIQVTPVLPALDVHVSGEWLFLHPRSKGRTKYQVTLPSTLRDVFGQSLERSQALTFSVGSAPPSMDGPTGLVVLDPASAPRLSLYTINEPTLRIRVHRVATTDWAAFGALMQKVWSDEALAPPGALAFDIEVPVQGPPDERIETPIDLAPALHGGVGHVVVVAESTRDTPTQRSRRIVAWVQATQLGLDAFADGTRLVAWVTSLRDGSPLPDVSLALEPGSVTARTDATGIAELSLPKDGASLLVARRGDDMAFLPAHERYYSYGDRGWRRRAAPARHAWYVFDDRQMYRPGEEVKIKGWIRRLGGGPTGDVEPLSARQKRVHYVATDARGNEIARGRQAIGRLGGFDLSLTLPPTVNLGFVAVDLAIKDGATEDAFQHTVQVQEFRRPEFEVTARTSEGPHRVGESAGVTVTAAYYAGGGLQSAPATWTVSTTPGMYTPPDRDDFTFGTWVPWWRPWQAPEPTRQERFEGRTDALGRHTLALDFVKVEPPRPTNVSVSASVVDVNRQAWATSAELLVHPSELYVGLRSERLFVQKGGRLRVDTIVTDIDGTAIPEREVTVRAERLAWRQVGGTWQEVADDTQECGVTSTAEPEPCTFEAREGGTWRVTAEVADARGRRNESQLRLWVAGGQLPSSRSVDQQSVELVPDRKAYAPGETAQILVLAPFVPAEGLLTLRRSGLVRHERFTIEQASHTLAIPIEDGFTPNVHVQVDLVGRAPRARDGGTVEPSLPSRPAFAAGALALAVPPASRALEVRVTPRARELEPGGATALEVELRDAAGNAVADAEVALVVVDEAILSLTGYRIADPLEIFYAARAAAVEDLHLRASVRLTAPEAVEEIVVTGSKVTDAAAPRAMSARVAESDMAAPAGAAPIRVRTLFGALALFAPSVSTDARGRAEVPVTLPDSLTRYRVMAVAVSGARRFGKGESTLVARLPLMVRPSPPRFLRFGDRFDLPVVLQNQTDAALEVDVAARATNAELSDGAGRRVTVPARDRVEIRLPAAARRAGTARLQIGGVAGRYADAADVSLPVYTPATTEAFATYGQLDAGAVLQPVTPPEDVIPRFGGLEITTSSTAVQALTDAVLYLVAYPFECSEQLASRVLAIAALRDVLSAFGADGLPPPAELRASVERDLTRLAAMQNADGGFPFWTRGSDSWPYLSIHAAHAIERAEAKGFAIPAGMRERVLTYLKVIDTKLPREYSVDVRRALEAYALYVRARMGDRDTSRARTLVRSAGVEALPLESLGWLLPVLSPDAASAAEVNAIRRQVTNRATETASTASFAVSYGEQGPHVLLHSKRRTDAVMLEAWIADQPQSDLIPKLVAGLLAQRKQGRWENTQENAFVLLALDRYFGTYESATPDFVARAWLGQSLALDQSFRGRETERRTTLVPMQALTELGPTSLVVAKDGPGRLYYRLGLRYAPANLTLEPADRGFAVERTYEAVDDPADVRRDADGTWRIRSGARVRVRLSMAAESRRYHVALVDPLPAGLEPLNPALAVTEALPPDAPQSVDVVGGGGLGGARSLGSWGGWRRVWFEHQNLRDDRAEAFTSLLWEGVYTYTYVARATTPGAFIASPAHAEEMYQPETFGRSGTDRVVVE